MCAFKIEYHINYILIIRYHELYPYQYENCDKILFFNVSFLCVPTRFTDILNIREPLIPVNYSRTLIKRQILLETIKRVIK